MAGFTEGVTTAIVLFIFAALCFPRLIKQRQQYYAALAAVLLTIVMNALAGIANSASFDRFSAFVIGILQVIAIVLLVLSAGGLTLGELGAEMADSYEVLRRGEQEKDVIIPIRGAMPARADAPKATKREEEPKEPKVYTIDDPGALKPAAPPSPPPLDRGSIPLDE